MRLFIQKANRQSTPLRDLVEKFDGEFWKAVVERLQTRLKNRVENRKANFLKMSELELKVALSQESEIEDLMRMPMDVQETLTSILDKQAEARGKLKEIQKQKRTGGI